MNYYELLEISSSASIEIIRNAYKTLAKKYHPDTYQGATAFAEEKMKLLNEAISVLEDEGKRREYNKINGINPMSQSGYSEYGRNNMINYDENGNPIFFSYDTDESKEYDKPDDNKSYMDIIDEFLNNSKSSPEKKPKKKSNKSNKSKEKEKSDSIDDIVEDISKINAKKFENTEIEFKYDNITEADDEEAELKTFNVRPKKDSGKLSRDKPFYITLAFLVAGIIFAVILIMQKINWDNIKDLLSEFSGNNNVVTEENIGNSGESNTLDEIDAFAQSTEPTSEFASTENTGNTGNTEDTGSSIQEQEEPTEPVTEAAITTATPTATAAITTAAPAPTTTEEAVTELETTTEAATEATISATEGVIMTEQSSEHEIIHSESTNSNYSDYVEDITSTDDPDDAIIDRVS